jgi:hypothetical protein
VASSVLSKKRRRRRRRKKKRKRMALTMCFKSLFYLYNFVLGRKREESIN